MKFGAPLSVCGRVLMVGWRDVVLATALFRLHCNEAGKLIELFVVLSGNLKC